ncbi:hypothetical protein [Brevundimonas sp.]|uniref:hypothetical protein n=1 Tax=Brevundimonas sp. TaxID=1871086 RepID=UPI001E19A5C2|nr:hypothetical protein [Brevundimonas sp.]MBL0947107.1 hypothetical protein [Brevundimonas sp.]
MSANTASMEHVRRLRPGRAMASAVKGLPRLWAGGWAGLVLLALMIPLGGWTRGSEPAQLLFTAIAAVLTLAVWTGLTAVALDRDPPPGGVAMGPVLLRVVLAAGLNLIFLAMIAVVLALVSLAIAGMSGLNLEAVQARDWAHVGPVWQLVVLGLVALIVLAVPLLLMVRLSLFVQATVGRGHAVSLNTMGIAQGSFWVLMLLFLGLAIPPLALLGWAASRGLMELAMVTLVGLWMPLSAGALAAAYGQLEYWSPDSSGHLGGG